MVKCFWCGAMNSKMADTCESCKRKLSWSDFFQAMLKPSMGCLLGSHDHDETEEHTLVAASTH